MTDLQLSHLWFKSLSQFGFKNKVFFKNIPCLPLKVYSWVHLISLFFISTVFVPNSIAQTTTKNYDVKIAGIKVGHFSAVETVGLNGLVTYEVNSKVNVNFLVYKMNTHFISKTRYSHGQLIHSMVNMNSNKGDFHTETRKTKGGYHIKGVHKDGPFEKTLSESIGMSVAKLYFQEPSKETQVFAEFYGGFMKIKKLENGVYHGKIADNEDLFYYTNGTLMKTIKKNSLKDLEFVYLNTITNPAR